MARTKSKVNKHLDNELRALTCVSDIVSNDINTTYKVINS